MTADEFHAYITDVRAQALAAMARLDTVDPATLPANLRQEYEQERAGWLEVLALTEDDAVALHLAAAEHAGRDLTDDEVKGLLVRQ